MTVLDCQKNRFGVDCAQECHCKDNKVCDNVDGTCPDAKCKDWYVRDSCSLYIGKSLL